MTTASKTAYAEIVDSLPEKRAKVFAAITGAGGTTIRETCAYMGWPWTTVSARFHELAEAGLIKGTGKRDGQTVWDTAKPDEVDALRATRKAAKRYETEVESSVPSILREGMTRVEVYIPTAVFEKLQRPARVRFL